MIWIFATLMVIILGLLLLVIYLLELLEKITFGMIEDGRNIIMPKRKPRAFKRS